MSKLFEENKESEKKNGNEFGKRKSGVNSSINTSTSSARKTISKLSRIFRNISLFVLATALFLFMIIIAISPALALQDLMALQGNVNDNGLPIPLGNLTVTIWTQPTGGLLIYNSSNDYNNAIVSGKFDVMLGDGSQDLVLEYSKMYYMDMNVNGQDLDFNGSDRRIFQSNVGSINGTIITSQNMMNVNSSVNAQYLSGISAGALLNNDSVISAKIDLLNISKASAGICPTGQFVQNTTTGGVQCGTPNVANPFNQNLNTGDNVQFKNITASNISALNIYANLNWSYILNIPSYVRNYDSDITLKLNVSDQRFNATSLIGAVNTSGNIQGLGFNTTAQLDSRYYSSSNPTGFVNGSGLSLYNDTTLVQNLNSSLTVLINGKLNVSDQRFNDTSLIGAVNTSGNIQSLGFNTTVQLNSLYLGVSDQRYNDTVLITGKLDASDQRYNDTAFCSALISSVGNWSNDKTNYLNSTADAIQDNNLMQTFNTSGNIQGLGFNTTVQLNSLYLGVSDQRYNATALITPKLSITDLIYDSSYYKSYDFESILAGYTNLWIPTPVGGGTSALIASLPNHPGIGSITSATTINSGYAYQIGSLISYSLGPGYISAATFKLYSQANSTNGTTNLRVGFLDSYTSAMPVDGVYLNFTQIANDTANYTVQAINRNNGVQNLTNITLNLNGTWISTVIRINTLNQSEFFVMNETGYVLWDTNVSNLIPSAVNRETGDAIYAFRSGTWSTQVIAHVDYIGVGINSTVMR